MKRVLITGERGYIGGSFARFLAEWPEDYETAFLSLRGSGWRQADLSGYDAIVHAAAVVHQKETAENAESYYRVNRDLTVELAEKARAEGVGQFVFLSTGGVYGKLEGVVTRDTRPRPATHYGRSKLEAERALISMSGECFTVAILRPLMVYGEGCKGNYQTLVKLARIAPLLPDYENRRSLTSIETLCRSIRDVVDQREEGIFFPQEKTPLCTCAMIQQIAEEQGRHLKRTKLLNPAVRLLKACTSAGKKAFGDLEYQDLNHLPL